MIEMLILAMILAKVVQNGVVDIAFAVRGKPSPRMASKSAKRPTGAAYSYFSDLWNDSWDHARVKHHARRARRQTPGAPAKPRGAATVFFDGLFQDGRRRARRSWDGAWERADEKRREKATRPRPGQDTVLGDVVPNRDGGQDEDRDRPQDEDRPASRTDEDETTEQDEPTVEDGPAERDAWRVRYPNGQTAITEDGDNYKDRPGYGVTKVRGYDTEHGFRVTHEHPEEAPITQEGPTAMTTTIPTDAEVIGLDPAISYCDTTVQACTAMQHSLEHTEAAIAAGGVTGVASEAFAQAKELFGQIATIMQGAGQEFVAHKAIQEAYDANPGAGTREFVTGGR